MTALLLGISIKVAWYDENATEVQDFNYSYMRPKEDYFEIYLFRKRDEVYYDV